MKVEERMNKYLIEASPIDKLSVEVKKYDKKKIQIQQERKKLSGRIDDLMRAYQQMYKSGKISDEEWGTVQGEISTLMSYV